MSAQVRPTSDTDTCPPRGRGYNPGETFRWGHTDP